MSRLEHQLLTRLCAHHDSASTREALVYAVLRTVIGVEGALSRKDGGFVSRSVRMVHKTVGV
jgi:hypothetical protein